MNFSNKVCNKLSNVCLSELEKVALTLRIRLGWKAFNSMS